MFKRLAKKSQQDSIAGYIGFVSHFNDVNKNRRGHTRIRTDCKCHPSHSLDFTESLPFLICKMERIWMPCFLLLLWAYREKTDAKPLYAKQHVIVTFYSHSFYCDQMLFQPCSRSSLVPASGQYLGGEAADFRTVALVGAKMLGEWKVIEAKKTQTQTPNKTIVSSCLGFILSVHCLFTSVFYGVFLGLGFRWALWRHKCRPSLAPCRMRRCMERTQESSWYLVLVYSFIPGRVLRSTLPFSYGKWLPGQEAQQCGQTVWDQPVSKQELG